jgi:hypothetical protein
MLAGMNFIDIIDLQINGRTIAFSFQKTVDDNDLSLFILRANELDHIQEFVPLPKICQR